MTLTQPPLPSASQDRTRRLWLNIGILLALIFSGGELAAIWSSGQLWAVLPVFIAAPIAYWWNRTGKQIPGSVLLLLALNLQFFLVLLVYGNISLMNSVTSLALAAVLCLLTLPREFFGRVLVSALVTLIIAFFIDLFVGSGGAQAPLNIGTWIFLFAMLTVFALFSGRDFLSWDIRTKIVTGILGTGALALAIFTFFVLNQSQQVTDVLQSRLDKSVSGSAEEQLVNQVLREANAANESFEDIAGQVVSLAQTWSALQGQSYTLNRTPYWDAGSELVQLDGGQYGNSATDPSSVFVPIGIQLDDTLIRDLNVSAYLDFSAPEVLRKYPSLLAVYAIDTRGSTRYYPNIELASKVPPDFNPAQRPYYTITAPLFNPQRQPRWAIPYIDKTGGGMVVTVAAPVYDGDRFIGIVAADMQLTGIAEQINSITAGQTGYAYIVDDAGRIIAMPDAGLAMFGLRKEDITPETFEKLTLLGLGSNELQSATFRMTSGGSGLLTVKVGEEQVDTYISFAPIKANGYSVALVVPVAELQGETLAAQAQTDQQIRAALQTAAVILIILFVVAIAVSLGLGQVIAAPIQRLTQVATQIAGGDLSVQAEVTTRDEIGSLAHSFNIMTARLRETLDGLERMVEERTAELLSANERNERRAKQFESIAQVSRTISSTRDFNALLPQITTLISREFGFYHVGIFLLDAGKEYAILSAANSEGGQNMLRRGHRLKVGEIGIVGYVTGTGNPRVALDTGTDAVFFNNPDLPDTHSEIALPLRSGEEIMGALDVQSTQPAAFSQEDISILSTLADQVSVAIQNARQFEQTRKALSEAEALAKQFAKSGWQQYTKDKGLVGVHHTGARATLLYEKEGPEKEEDSWDGGASKPKTRGAFLSLPIQLRGETIGSVNVRSPDNRPWDQDELDVVTAIIERAAIAMENARLLEESQRLASKEAKIGAVTAKIGTSINMSNVLQIAVEELGRALPGSEVVIQFQTDQNKNKAA